MPDLDVVIDGVATRFSTLMHTGRGLLLDLTSKGHRTGALACPSRLVDQRNATTTADTDLTAVLVRPDGHICWLESAVQPCHSSLHVAIEQWFGD